MLRKRKNTGYIYIAGNKAMPGLVKIGMTSNAPGKRLKELYTTGVPYPFHLHYAQRIKNPRSVEKQLHKIFQHYRVSNKREFFSIDAKDAVRITERSVRDISTSGRSHGTLWFIVLLLVLVMLFLLHKYHGIPVLSEWLSSTTNF